MEQVSSIPDREFEIMETVEHPTAPRRRLVLLVSKAGGGTVGRRYEGTWIYRVREAQNAGASGILAEGSDLRTPSPRTHEQALRLLEDFLPGLLAGPDEDDSECRDGDGEPWPEHDFPPVGHGSECRRCGAEADEI
jgi:hypothetical protein